MYDHLLVGLDGSSTAERVLDHAQALATAFGSTITLLRATVAPETLMAETANTSTSVGDVGSELIDPTPIVEADHQEAVDYLEGVASRLRQRNLTVNTDLPVGAAADALVERATALDAGLILLTTHGRGGLARMVFGSVADSVLRHAPCPVLLVRVSHDERQPHANGDASRS